ncbi:MAG: MATE family efflux transporter [Enterococcus sp.]|nr:MATE family efflux transporter [Enterococcus sp.]
MKAKIQLSDRFTYSRLIHFTWPSMVMMLINSVYSVVDGIMVSNFAGTIPFAALNLIWPMISILGSVGFMIGTGGSALVAKTLGEGNAEKASDIFSMLSYFAIAIAVVLSLAGLLMVRDIAIMLGAQGEMIEHCVTYGSILLYALPAYTCAAYFQSLLVTAEKPQIGLWISVGAGITNVVLDLLFLGVWKWGLAGAAWATAVSQVIGGGVPLAYFIAKRNSSMALRLGRCHIDFKAFGKVCGNGISEFMINISLSIVCMLYMYILLKEMGENGVAAYGIMMYYAFIFNAIYIGFGVGTAPVISYNYGAKNANELKSLLRKSLTIIIVTGVLVTIAAQCLALPLSAIFVSYDTELLNLTVRAFRIYSLMFIVAGFNIFASSFFTALNNGPVSAFISILRTLVFEAGCVIVLPLIFGIEVIWWSVFVAESITMMVSFFILFHYRKRYGYL